MSWISAGMAASVWSVCCRSDLFSRDDAGLIPAVKATLINTNRGAVSFLKCMQQGSIYRIYSKNSKKEPTGLRYSVKLR